MWTLVLIYAMSSGGRNASYATSSIDHIDGFASQQVCIAAAKKIQQVNTRIDSGIHVVCIEKR